MQAHRVRVRVCVCVWFKASTQLLLVDEHRCTVSHTKSVIPLTLVRCSFSFRFYFHLIFVISEFRRFLRCDFYFVHRKMWLQLQKWHENYYYYTWNLLKFPLSCIHFGQTIDNSNYINWEGKKSTWFRHVRNSITK